MKHIIKCTHLLFVIGSVGCGTTATGLRSATGSVFFSVPAPDGPPGIYVFAETSETNVASVFQTDKDSGEIHVRIVNRFAKPIFLRLTPPPVRVVGATVKNGLRQMNIGARGHARGRRYVFRDSLLGKRFVLLNNHKESEDLSDGYSAYQMVVPIPFWDRLTSALPAPDRTLHIEIRPCYYFLDGMRHESASLRQDLRFNMADRGVPGAVPVKNRSTEIGVSTIDNSRKSKVTDE